MSPLWIAASVFSRRVSIATLQLLGLLRASGTDRRTDFLHDVEEDDAVLGDARAHLEDGAGVQVLHLAEGVSVAGVGLTVTDWIGIRVPTLNVASALLRTTTDGVCSSRTSVTWSSALMTATELLPGKLHASPVVPCDSLRDAQQPRSDAAHRWAPGARSRNTS